MKQKKERFRRHLNDLEATIRGAYTEKEFRRLVQRLRWAIAELDDVVRRVPEVADLAPATTASASSMSIEDIVNPDSRAALSWLLDVLQKDPAQGFEIRPTDKVQLRIIRGGRSHDIPTLFDMGTSRR